jgi:hypothetical protein
MQRRDFLKVLGGGIIIAASAEDTWSQPRDPIAPWSPPVRDTDLRRFALSHAILSPNPHNRQPWLVDLSKADEVTLFCDRDRLLPVTDPFSRQVMIGLGAFIETFAIATASAGRVTEVAPFPEGFPEDTVDSRPVARLRLMSEAASPDPLFAFILGRRSVKAPYDMARTIPQEALAALRAAPRTGLTAFGIATAADEVAAMRGFMSRAGEIEVMTPRTWRESVDLMRIGHSAIAENPDGIALGGPMIESLLADGRISRSVMADTASPVFKAGADRWIASTIATPAALWFATADNRRTDQIDAGRAWMRIALTAVQHGLSLHPMSQVLQEFSEMAAEYAAFHAHVGVRGPARVQMLARLGYGPAVGPTPRWPLETRIRPA